MATIQVDKDQFVRRCEEAYGAKRDYLERNHYGKIVALYEGGVAGVGEDVDAARREAIGKHPNRIFYFRRVGRLSAAEMIF